MVRQPIPACFCAYTDVHSLNRQLSFPCPFRPALRRSVPAWRDSRGNYTIHASQRRLLQEFRRGPPWRWHSKKSKAKERGRIRIQIQQSSSLSRRTRCSLREPLEPDGQRGDLWGQHGSGGIFQGIQCRPHHLQERACLVRQGRRDVCCSEDVAHCLPCQLTLPRMSAVAATNAIYRPTNTIHPSETFAGPIRASLTPNPSTNPSRLQLKPKSSLQKVPTSPPG